MTRHDEGPTIHVPPAITAIVIAVVASLVSGASAFLVADWIKNGKDQVRQDDQIAQQQQQAKDMKDVLAAMGKKLEGFSGEHEGMRAEIKGLKEAVAALSARVETHDHRMKVAPMRLLENVYVVSDIGQYEYWLRTADGHKFYTKFCTDQPEPAFSSGQLLATLRYQERPDCWGNVHYFIERRHNGDPIKEEIH